VIIFRVAGSGSKSAKNIRIHSDLDPHVERLVLVPVFSNSSGVKNCIYDCNCNLHSLDAAQWSDWDSEEEDEIPCGRPRLGGAGDFNAGLNGVGTASTGNTESHLTLNSGNHQETAR